MTRRPLWNRRRGLLAAIAIVVLTNAVVFVHVAWNRSGGPTARLELTDRELHLPYYDFDLFEDREDTGLALDLDVQGTSPDWLDRDKLAELGFDVGIDPSVAAADRHYRSVLPREVWLVLEYDGEAWRRWLADREHAVEVMRDQVAAGERTEDALRDERHSLTQQRVEASRLFAIDAGLDRGALRARYADPARYAVVPGIARLSRWGPYADEEARLSGSIGPAVSTVQVPLRFRPVVEKAVAERQRRRNRAADSAAAAALGEAPLPPPEPAMLGVEVAFGRLGEPWLVSAEPLEAETPAPASDSQTEPVDDEDDGGSPAQTEVEPETAPEAS